MPGRTVNTTRWVARSALAVAGLVVAAALTAVGTSPASAAESTLCTGFGSCSSTGRTNFGYEHVYRDQHWRQDGGHNCTNYVGFRFEQHGIGRPSWATGGAAAWGDNAGAPLDSTPSPGAIAWWRTKGSAGHVAIVEKVNADGSIETSDDVWKGDFHWRRYTPGGSAWPTGFIHLDDAAISGDTDGGGGDGTSVSGNGGQVLQNPHSGRCVDVDGLSPLPGTKPVLWDCYRGPGQQWIYSGSALHVFGGVDDRCLDVPNNDQRQGQSVQLWTCNGQPAQQWSIETDGTIRSTGDLCLTAHADGTTNGTTLELWPCYGGPSQKWVGPAIDNGGTVVQNPSSGRCMDVSGPRTNLSTTVQLWDCGTSAGQHWIYDPTTRALRVFNNLCLDARVADGQASNGRPLQTYACSGAPQQRWTINPDGSIVSGLDGRCIIPSGRGTTNGTPLVLWSCDHTVAHQRWVGPGIDNGGRSIRNPSSGRCMDVSGPRTNLSTTVQLWDCGTSAGQHWIYDPTTRALRVFNNLCLDARVADGQPSNGRPLQTYACSGAPQQRWTINPDGSIVSGLDGRCIIPSGRGTTNGTPLVLWSCDHTVAHQRWVGPVTAIASRVSPRVTGRARVGRTLTASPGRWSVAGLTVRFAWIRDTAVVRGANGRTYRLTRADKGHRISVRVTVSRTGYITASRTSSRTPRVR